VWKPTYYEYLINCRLN